ncbi:hypothetical protein AB0B85_01540 [Micromonospora sp. NPDC049044]|uniref:hypothetical protein n=1 Tax=unclassified Micromonospora TaxID=2617518 RepID=UPI0033F26FE0
MRRITTIGLTAGLTAGMVAAVAVAGPAQAAYRYPYTTICSPTTTVYADSALTQPVRTVPVGTWADVLAFAAGSDQVQLWDDPTGASYWVASSCLRVVKH